VLNDELRAGTVYLNALQAFEAAGRLQSFVAAAAELNVTASAVSQRVKALEAYLGQTLFVRSRQGVTLTSEAAAAFPAIRDGFAMIAGGLARLRTPVPANIVTVSVTPAFAGKWLLPRIERFRDQHPSLDIRLDSTNRLVDFLVEGIDIGVRYGAGQYEGLAAERMMGEEVFPVCSPRLLDGIEGQHIKLCDLPHLTLIHDSTFDFDPSFPTWSAWLVARGFDRLAEMRGLQFNSSVLAIEAAVEGQGVALGRSALVQSEILSRRLVRPFEEQETSRRAYYVVYRRSKEMLPRVKAVRDWLMLEAKGAC
jgi:LysR family transcriptional regulator, glycine cleavage system transcriptional activator